ncbi:MAG: hypothetical protein RL330_510 [Actinomycetota bacterium]|jgi:hypothetical protein
MDTKELLSVAAPLINDLGAAFYFVPETGQVGKDLGLNGMEFYILGRGGSLGDCDPALVSSAFGYFNPAVIAGVWNGARDKVAPRRAAEAHLECCAAFGRAKLEGLDLAAFVAAAEKVNTAADPDSLALYAGISSLDLATDPSGRAMQLIAVLREFRGSAHLAALRAAGIDSKTAHHIKRPDMVAMFGWGPDDAPTTGPDEEARLARAEEITDSIVAPAFSVLDNAERTALVDGLRAIAARVKG